MKTTRLLSAFLLFSMFIIQEISAQNLDVEWTKKLNLSNDSTANKIVVQKPDGTLATQNTSDVISDGYIEIKQTDFSTVDDNDTVSISNFTISDGQNRLLMAHFQGTSDPGVDSVSFNGIPMIKSSLERHTFYLAFSDSEGPLSGDIVVALPENSVGFLMVAEMCGVDQACPFGLTGKEDTVPNDTTTVSLKGGFGDVMFSFISAADFGGGCVPTIISSTVNQVDHVSESLSFSGFGGLCAGFAMSSREFTQSGDLDMGFESMGAAGTGEMIGITVQRADRATFKYEIGDTLQDGIVFYVDHTGMHGLIVSIYDAQDTPWSNGLARTTNAQGLRLFDGATNTMLIIAQHTADNPASTFAAQEAFVNFQSNFFGGWYLPAKEELELVYENLHVPQILTFSENLNYWSSSEEDSTTAYSLDFSNGSSGTEMKSANNHVRPIRRF